MKISIVIPVFNSEKYLDKLLESINKQDYDNYEVIMINDGSTDSSEKIIKKYESSNKRISHYNIENSGPGIARKIGYSKVTGNLVFFVDSDDYLPFNDTLSKINKIYTLNPFDMLFFNFFRCTTEGTQTTNVFFKKIKTGYLTKEFINNNKMGGALWGKIISTSVLNNDYFIDSNNYEDYYTSYKCLKNCNRIFFTNEILYFANRDNANSLSKKINVSKIIKTVEVLEKIAIDTSFKKAVNQIIYDYYIWLIWYSCKQKQLLNKENKEQISLCVNKLKSLLKFQIKNIMPSNYKNIIKLMIFKITNPLKGDNNE